MAQPSLEQFLRSIPLFAQVETAQMMDLLRLVQPVDLEAGEVLFRQGTPGKAMWVLGEGAEVSISIKVPASKRPVELMRATAGQSVGEMALVSEGERSGTAVVTRPGKAHRIQAIDFQSLRDAYNPGAFQILKQLCIELCQKLRATSDQIAPALDDAWPGAELKNLGRAPTELVEKFGPFGTMPQVVRLALSQKLELVESASSEVIFAEGEVGDAIYFLVAGEVEVRRGERVFLTHQPGETFGIVSVIDGGPRSATCASKGPVQLLRLGKADVDGVFATGNRFSFQMVDLVCRQLVHDLTAANLLFAQKPASEERFETPPVDTVPIDL